MQFPNQGVAVALLCLLAMLAGCRPQLRTKSDFYQWLHQPEHGLVQTRQANGLRLTAKYLPPELLALRDWERLDNPRPADWDSLLKTYTGTPSFLLTIEPAAGKGGDVLYRDIASVEAFKERAMDMNFRADQYLRLETGAGAFPPVLHTLENTYSTREGRSIYLVFAPPASAAGQADRLDLVFTDEWFGTGISHFGFSRSALAAVPAVDFLSYK